MANKPKQQRQSGLDVVLSKGQRLDPSIKQLMKTAVKNKAALTAKQRRDRKRKRATYDVDPAIHQALQRIAKHEDTSASQVAEFLIAVGLLEYAKGNDDLLSALLDGRSLAHTMRFSWNLSIPEAWLQIIKNIQKQEAKKPTGWGI